MNVENILKRKGTEVATIAPGATVAEALARLKEHNVGALVVSADRRTVAGILSERDIVRRLADEGARLLDQPVSAVMTKNVYSCRPDDSIAELMTQMTVRRIRHLPVVVSGRLVGIVSIGDVVKDRVEEVEQEAQALREYITQA
jgi:CBS domain-containing protein